MDHVETVGKMYNVSWIWVMSCELSLAGMLAPSAALYPIESITIYPLMWVFILHPGSTQTSGLVRLYQDVLDEIEIEMNRLRKTMLADWARLKLTIGAGVKNPYTDPISICTGSGN